MANRQEFNNLKKRLLKCLDLNYEDANEQQKQVEASATFKHKNRVMYETLVYMNFDEDTIHKLEPVIELCTTPKQNKTWSFLRQYTSSVVTNKNPGRNMRFIVRDKSSTKILGIFAIGSDIFHCEARDKAIGWTHSTKQKNLTRLVNIWCCVSMQPIGYNTNLGKLLASLCFSEEVFNAYKNKYKDTIACITTFSINGKSIQYDRLPHLKLAGFTKGFGSVKVPPKLYLQIIDYLKRNGVDINEQVQRIGRMEKLRYIASYFGVSEQLCFHARERGVYIGFLGDKKECIDYLCDSNGDKDLQPSHLQSVDVIVRWWKHRWAAKRYDRLFKNDTIRRHILENVEEVKEQRKAYMKEYRNIHKDAAEVDVDKIRCDETLLKRLTPSYIAGFIDGDGTIGVSASKYERRVYVSVTQCDITPLVLIQRLYGGTIRVMKRHDPIRQQYVWDVLNLDCKNILSVLSQHSILKQKRAILALKILDTMKAAENCDDLFAEMYELQKDYTPVSEEVYDERMNKDYIAGFFDAEGYVAGRMRHGKYLVFDLTLTQKNSTVVLHKIRQHLENIGHVASFRFVISSITQVVHFMDLMKPLCVVKLPQLEHALNIYAEWQGERRIDVLTEYITTLSSEKHCPTSVDFDKLTSENVRVLARTDNHVEKAEMFEKKQAAFRKRQSQGMTGKSRRQMTIEHSVALSVALKEKLHPVADENIVAIR
jgi:hypothetical protein